MSTIISDLCSIGNLLRSQILAKAIEIRPLKGALYCDLFRLLESPLSIDGFFDENILFYLRDHQLITSAMLIDHCNSQLNTCSKLEFLLPEYDGPDPDRLFDFIRGNRSNLALHLGSNALEYYRQSRLGHFFITPLRKLIDDDNVDSLSISIAQAPNFDYELTFVGCALTSFRDIKLFDYVASRGAIKCFKFILLNNACAITSTTLQCAIFSGSQEIIQLCLEKGAELNGALCIAFYSHRLDIAEWLIDCHHLTQDEVLDKRYPIHWCAQAAYFKGMVYIGNQFWDMEKSYYPWRSYTDRRSSLSFCIEMAVCMVFYGAKTDSDFWKFYENGPHQDMKKRIRELENRAIVLEIDFDRTRDYRSPVKRQY